MESFRGPVDDKVETLLTTNPQCYFADPRNREKPHADRAKPRRASPKIYKFRELIELFVLNAQLRVQNDRKTLH